MMARRARGVRLGGARGSAAEDGLHLASGRVIAGERLETGCQVEEAVDDDQRGRVKLRVGGDQLRVRETRVRHADHDELGDQDARPFGKTVRQ